MSDDKQRAIKALGDAMSEVSEDCWCAGWLDGTEDVLPNLCKAAIRTGQPQGWGMWSVSIDTAEGLIAMAKHAGTWVNFNSLDDPEYVPYEPKWWEENK